MAVQVVKSNVHITGIESHKVFSIVAGNVNDMMVGNAITTCVSTTAFH
jgi:hypothetical protein